MNFRSWMHALIITVAQGMDDNRLSSTPLIHQSRENSSSQQHDDLLETNLTEELQQVFYSSNLKGRAVLALINPLFSEKSLWIRTCRKYLPNSHPCSDKIKSWFSYVVLATQVKTHFVDPLTLKLDPAKLEQRIDAAFIPDRATQLKRYLKEARIWTEQYIGQSQPSADYSIDKKNYFEQTYYEIFATEGEPYSQVMLYRAVTYCGLNFTPETVIPYLKERIKKGDMQARHTLNRLADNCQFGFTPDKARHYFEKRAQKGDLAAQSHLKSAATDGRLGFTRQTGLEYLKDRISQEDHNAQSIMNNWAYAGESGFDARSGREHLKSQVNLEDKGAQLWLDELKQEERWDQEGSPPQIGGGSFTIYKMAKDECPLYFPKAKEGKFKWQEEIIKDRLQNNPEEAVTVRWLFAFYNTVMGFTETPFDLYNNSKPA